MSKRKEKKKNKKITLSNKLVRIISVILLIVMIAIITATYKGLDIIYLGYSAITTFYAAREIEDVYDTHPDDFSLKMDSVERTYELNVEMYKKDGTFIYSSSYKGEMSSPPYDENSIVLPDSAKRNYTEEMNLGATSNNAFNLSLDERGNEYLVCTWTSDSGVTIKLFKLKNVVDSNAKLAVAFVSSITVVVVFIALIIIMAFVRHTTKPLKNMSDITNNMAKLDFSRKCESNNVAEISTLSDSINTMSDSLENALVDLQQRNKKLQDDIEKEKTLDQIRQVFISGVSHELKTPIAIIQGYAEGLKIFLETDPATADKYCDTIISETERMNNLVMKLLDITKYQSGEYKLSYEQFNLFEIVDDWFNRNKAILTEKNITHINEIDNSYVAFADSFIISTVINNYMSNAVSHVNGDMIIKASAEELDNDVYRVSIFNKGIPIADRDIDKIWDSFYRADKAMSRAHGRFGLGLAVVASIQRLHGQKYGVINHEDGVEFWFDVKKYIDDGIGIE